jgi:repressor LexA
MFSMHNRLTEQQSAVCRLIEKRFDRGEPPPTVREICQHFNFNSTRAATDHLVALERKGFIARDKKCARGIRLIRRTDGVPLLGTISAGYPRLTSGELSDQLTVNPEHFGIRDRSRAFALRVSGDSMVGRQLFDGDIVLLEHGAETRPGDIVAALIDNESTLKTLVQRNGKTWLQSENARYPDLIPTLGLEIQGVARGVIRVLPR